MGLLWEQLQKRTAEMKEVIRPLGWPHHEGEAPISGGHLVEALEVLMLWLHKAHRIMHKPE